MNKELLLATKERILNEPEFFNMDLFHVEGEDKNKFSCGTTCCISGHAAFLADPENWPSNAAEGEIYLGEVCQALFFPDNWHPDVLPSQEKVNNWSLITAEEAAAAIDHFIENDGWSDINFYHPNYEENESKR